MRRSVMIGFVIWCGGVLAPQAGAVTRVWDGGGADNNASTAANWCNGDTGADEATAPTTGDAVRFGGASTGSCVPHATKNCTFNINLGGYDFNSFILVNTGTAYTGTVTLSNSIGITNDLTVASGTFTMGSGLIVEASTFGQTGGTVTPTANSLFVVRSHWTKTGGTWTGGNGTIQLSGAGNMTPGSGTTYNNITIDTSTYTLQGALSLAGTLTINASGGLNTNATSNYAVTATEIAIADSGVLTANDSVIQVNGNWTKTGGTFTAGTSLVDFRTAGNVNFNPGGLETTYYDVQIVKGAGNAVTLTGDLKVSNQLILTVASSGALNGSSYRIELTKSGVSPNHPFTVDGAADFTAGTSTVAYTATGTTTLADVTYYNLEVDKAGVQFNLKAGATTAVSNFLTMRGSPGSLLVLRSTSAGTWGTFNVTGDFLVSDVDVNDINSCGGNTITGTGLTIGGNAACWSAGTRVPTGPGPGTPPAY